jgi:cytochrome-b5 reductase
MKGSFELMVKHYPNGPMSTHLHDMNVGQLLSIRGPIPKYKWEENKYCPNGQIDKDTSRLE